MKSGFFVFPKHAKNGKILPFEVEQKVEIKSPPNKNLSY